MVLIASECAAETLVESIGLCCVRIVVETGEENRLDLIANTYLGSATYSWVIAYFNQIEDGYTVREGQTLIIPKTITSLFSDGEILAPITALALNLGEE